MLEQLVTLASERSSERRRELLASLSDLFYSDVTEVRSDLELQLFASVVSRVLKDVSVDGRAEFAARVAPDDRTPREVVVELANDAASVAAPVLKNSPLLTDDDLVDIAQTATTRHRVAIAQRENIGESVSETLVGFEEEGVVETLAENRSAEISHSSFEKLAGMSAKNPRLSSRLSLRDDLPVTTARKILPYLEDEAAAKLERLIESNLGEVEKLVDKAAPQLRAQRSEASRRRIVVRSLMRDVEIGRMRLDAALLQLTERGHALDVAFGLSLVSGLPESQVAHAVINVRREPLALVCKSIDVSPGAYVEIDRLRSQVVRLPPSPPDVSKAAYARLDRDTAMRTLRFVRVRNALSGNDAGA